MAHTRRQTWRSARLLLCLALGSLAQGFPMGAYRQLVCQSALDLMSGCQTGVLGEEAAAQHCCNPFRTLNLLQCLCSGEVDLMKLMNMPALANLQRCGETDPAAALVTSCGGGPADAMSDASRQAESVAASSRTDTEIDVGVDVDVDMGSDMSDIVDSDISVDLDLDLESENNAETGAGEERGEANDVAVIEVEAEESQSRRSSPVDVLMDVVVGLARAKGLTPQRSSSSLLLGDEGEGLDAQLDLMYDGTEADMDSAMKNVAKWIASLLPILTAGDEGNAADRMDRSEQLGSLLANLGNLVSGVGSSLTQALQEGSHPADIDIKYEIDVDVDPKSRDYEAEIDIDVNSNVDLLSSHALKDKLQALTASFWSMSKDDSLTEVSQSAGEQMLTELDLDTEVSTMEVGAACVTMWCQASRWVCNNQEGLLVAIQIELGLVAVGLLSALLWTLGMIAYARTCQPQPDEEGLQEKLLQGDYEQIEDASDYVDPKTHSIPPLWAVMEKGQAL